MDRLQCLCLVPFNNFSSFFPHLSSGSIDLESGGCLYNHLKQGEQSLVLANYLHLLYLVTPYDLAQDVSPSWMIYLQQVTFILSVGIKYYKLRVLCIHWVHGNHLNCHFKMLTVLSYSFRLTKLLSKNSLPFAKSVDSRSNCWTPFSSSLPNPQS